MKTLIEAVDAVLIDLQHLHAPGAPHGQCPAGDDGGADGATVDIQWQKLEDSLGVLQVELSRHKAELSL